MQSSSNQRKIVHYGGQVQGVGFRYTAQRISQQYEVVGYVRNLRDGRVEIVAESSPECLAKFLDSIAEAMSGYIQETQIDLLPWTGEFDRFEIRY